MKSRSRSFMTILCASCLMAVALCAQAPPEFEVASIRPSPPPGDTMVVGCSGGPGTSDPALFRCTNMDLANLVRGAFALRSYEFREPDWASDTKFELQASIPAGTTKEQFLQMFQALLKERFHVAYHRVDERVQGFEMYAAKGGLKTGAAMVPEGYPQVKDSGVAGSHGRSTMRFHKQSMTELARVLSGRLKGPVIDRTGLSGTYEIRLYWASDGISEEGPTLLEALGDQLGLRVEARKVAVSMFILDHADRMPSAN